MRPRTLRAAPALACGPITADASSAFHAASGGGAAGGDAATCANDSTVRARLE